MSYPNELKYTQDHEWVRIEGDIITLGITHYAGEQLGDIVFVELPTVGAQFSLGDSLGVIESTKSVADVLTPFSGTVVEVNDPLTDEPERINSEPYGEGWMVKLKVSGLKEGSQLMSADQYETFLQEQE